ncbi:MAG: acylneuraminate cytidylyltransferase family protein [Elusimicrobia bacterium]|nr:acylneuraminate cytidylyltransferase family protein [Elusimicrobiota bacterium]
MAETNQPFELLGIIPARGGSKSIPLKNIRLLAGKPLIAHTIEAAKASSLLTRVIVSTDHPEIARVSKEWGGEVPFMRPDELAGDFIEDWPVFDHALRWLQDQEGYSPEAVLRLPPTSPLRRSHHIDEAIRLLQSHPEADSVRSVCEAPKHPLKMWRIDRGRLEPFVDPKHSGIQEAYNKPRQKLPAAYIQNGAVEVIRASTVLKKKSMSGDIILAYEMKPEESVNIDSLMDFEWAEFLVKKRVP